MKRLLSLTALGSLLTAVLFLAVQPVLAGDVDERIQALEQELSQLKAEQAQLKDEQMEFRKEATAAGAKLPTFSYRGGSGMRITAADKSWMYRLRARAHNWLLFRDGVARERGGQGEVFARRARIHNIFCVDNCFIEVELSLDLDGFGGNSSDTNMQRGATFLHFERLNPWMPTFYFGEDIPSDLIRRRSSSRNAKLDYDIVTRSLFNTGSMGNGMGLTWEDIPLSGLGIPGNIGWLTFARGNLSPSDGAGRFTDKADYALSMGVAPFEETKSKWLQGIELSWGLMLCAFDHAAADNECERFRLRETDGPVRDTVWEADYSPGDGSEDNDSFGHMLATGYLHEIGPYTLRAMGAWAQLGESRGKVRMRGWEISHELFLWSPKGFLTGSPNRGGSWLIGYAFERADGYCNPPACDNDGEYESNHLILNQVSVMYFIRRRISTGVVWNHWDAKKVTSSLQEELECRGTGVAGKGCDWDNVMVVFKIEW